MAAGDSVGGAMVTVIMPTYERTDYLRQAIESALSQHYGDLVLLIGDNSTSDAVEDLVRTYDDPRIRYHRNRPALGPQENWVDLANRATTPLLASLHDDDVWEPDFLAEVVPIMTADSSVDMVFTDYWIIDATGEIDRPRTEKETRRNHRDQLERGVCNRSLEQGLRVVAAWNAPQPAYAAVLRTEAVQRCRFPDAISPLYDIWLSYHLVRQGRGLFFEPRRLTRYRVHGSSMTSSGLAEAEDAFFTIVLSEHEHLPVADEIAEYWADLRWGRATRMMCQEGAQAGSQSELRAASAHLHGLRRLAAEVGGRSNMVWQAMRLLKVRKYANVSR